MINENYILPYRLLIAFCITSFLICSCSNPSQEVSTTPGPAPVDNSQKKPPSSFKDTLLIMEPSAVFYHPDSIQLEKIKAVIDPTIFEGSMHEYFFQMRNARMVLKKHWPGIRIVEAMNTRWLGFIRAGKDTSYVDLDTQNEPYGIYLFDGLNTSLHIDMTNIDTELGFYFKKGFR